MSESSGVGSPEAGDDAGAMAVSSPPGWYRALGDVGEQDAGSSAAVKTWWIFPVAACVVVLIVLAAGGMTSKPTGSYYARNLVVEHQSELALGESPLLVANFGRPAWVELQRWCGPLWRVIDRGYRAFPQLHQIVRSAQHALEDRAVNS